MISTIISSTANLRILLTKTTSITVFCNPHQAMAADVHGFQDSNQSRIALHRAAYSPPAACKINCYDSRRELKSLLQQQF